MTEIVTMLRREVEQSQGITFARFMDLALYCPDLGYYEQEQGPIGRRGDYYTSVSVGPLFGKFLGCQFCRWLEGVTSPEVHLVEAGAHDGGLARDILTWIEAHQPKVFERLVYSVIEPSPRRRARQRTALAKFAARTRWVDSPEALAKDGIRGVIFSNELLDAFPVHRVGWDVAAQDWFEWGVGLSDDRFVWRRLKQQDTDCDIDCDWSAVLVEAGFELSSELRAVLPDGFTLDISPTAGEWWRQAARALREGYLVTLDYGLTAEQCLSPSRHQGTLRAYRDHRLTADVLTNPGAQDLTAHINFTQLERIGEAERLRTEGRVSQSNFLGQIAQGLWQANGQGTLPTQSEIRQFHSLTHPEHLGGFFQVLTQSRPGCL